MIQRVGERGGAVLDDTEGGGGERGGAVLDDTEGGEGRGGAG